MLVHERFVPFVQLWQPSTSKHLPPSPYYSWFQVKVASGLPRPLLLAAGYLPPYGSKYGLRSERQLEDFFARLGDEVAEAAAVQGGADVALAGDWNGHLGQLQESGEFSTALVHALGWEAEEVLVPCASNCSVPIPLRASMCSAPVCSQGKALLQLCSATGLLVMNGRLPGDEQGNPTCFAGAPSLIDIFVGSPALLMQAMGLHVLEPVPEYVLHRPVELRLALSHRTAQAVPPTHSAHHQPTNTSPQQQPASAGAAATATGEGEDTAFGPAPSFPPALRLNEDLFPSYEQQLLRPAVQRQLGAVSELADSNPEAAASLLSLTLYESAAAVFPQASTAPKQQRQERRGRLQHLRQQPWFDRECELARERFRTQMLAEPNSHLGSQAVKVLGSKYGRLLDQKRAVWRRQRSKALVLLHRTNIKAFMGKWKPKAGPNPISPAAWVRHYVHLQQKRKFKPSRQQPTAAMAAAAPPPPTTSLPTTPPSPATTHPTNPDPHLDQDWTADDVQEALKKLSRGSACLGPLKAALIKAGGGLLAPVLAKLFTAVFRSGKVPREWLLGAISAIHKKGDTSDPNNYRGITVGHVLGKLYALMLNRRLSTWAEANGKRAAGQAGFRKGFRTTDNCFVLRALVERARAKGAKLYICAVDLEKAFDSVDRPLLWAALQRAGIGGCMLGALQALYADVPVCVKTAEGLSSTFQSTIGVKQGCPLSPLLFGIFLDDFELHLQRTVSPALAQLPSLCGCPVPPLLFADDMLLISTSVAGLNAQLQSLQTYCDAKMLTVNAAKTQVVIMRPGGGSGGRLAANEKFFYAGQQLEVVSSIKYLGLTFSQLSKAHGFACCAEELAKAGRRALFAMRRRAWELGAGAVGHQSRLFDIFVLPVLSYGCEIWGVDVLAQPDSAPERVHRWFCRRLLSLPQGASSAVALAELGRWPLHVLWVQQLVRYWNRMLELQGSGRLASLAFQDNLNLMQEQLALKARTGKEVPSPCWALRWLRSLGSLAPTDTGTLLGVTELDEEAVVTRAREAWVRAAATAASKGAQQQQHGSGLAASPLVVKSPQPHGGLCCNLSGVSQHPSPGLEAPRPLVYATASGRLMGASSSNKFAFYLEHVRGDWPLGQMAPHLAVEAVQDDRHRSCLSRFRCSSHSLRVETDRHLPDAIKPARHHRTCLICASDSVEDEGHFIFSCPLYAGLRFDYADIFSTDCQTLEQFLSHPNQDRIAQFVYACFKLRSQTTLMSLAGS